MLTRRSLLLTPLAASLARVVNARSAVSGETVLATRQSSTPSDEDFARFVNPFVGTAGHGHTYPGATVPFGMVQLSPDTRTDGWDAASGYHDSDRDIMGFSHIHLSGVGIND